MTIREAREMAQAIGGAMGAANSTAFVGTWLGVPGTSISIHFDRKRSGLRYAIHNVTGEPDCKIRLIEGDGRPQYGGLSMEAHIATVPFTVAAIVAAIKKGESKMTFQEFQATKREATRADLEAVGYDCHEETKRGFIYADGLVIEATDGWSTGERAAYFLLVERSSYLSDDLEDLERLLFDFGIDAGYIEGDPHKYLVFNQTDGIYASPEPMTRPEAWEWMQKFRARFEAQGYYASTAGRIAVADLKLTLEPVTEETI